MALTTNSFDTTFDLSQSPKVFLFTDQTNYAGQGVNPSDCKCVLEITAPGGAVIYNNTDFNNPDIDPGVSPLNIIQILVPLGANGLPVPGMYTFKMTTQVDDGIAPAYTVDSSYNFTYQYVSPVVSINQTVNCVSPLFTSTDNTVYTVNNIIPSISRVHSIYFPVGSGLSTLTGSTQILTRGSNQFANGTQTTQITTTLIYAMDSNVTIFDTVTGALEIQVSCEWTCKITCCLKALNNRMESQRCSNYPAFLQTKDIFTQVMSKVTLVMQLISCGKESEVSPIISQIQDLANCTDDCCGQDTPSLVNGINGGAGSGNIAVVESGGAPVTVTDVTVGDTTTYTITIDPAFLTTVNNSYNTVLANGGGITWTDSGVVGGVRTFTPNLSIPSQNMMAFQVYMTFQNATPPVTIAVQNVSISGSAFQAPTVATVQLSPTVTDNNCFVVNNFFTGAPNTNYKVYATMQIKETHTVDLLSFVNKPPVYMYEYTGGPQSSGSFQFRLDNKIASSAIPMIYKTPATDNLVVTINFLIIA